MQHGSACSAEVDVSWVAVYKSKEVPHEGRNAFLFRSVQDESPIRK